MKLQDNLRYTKDHEWILIEENTGTIGITDYAQGELGDIVFVELPQPGKEIKAGTSFGTIEAVKAVSDLIAPVSGTIMEINKELDGTPEVVNQDPYGKGWMMKVKLANPSEAALLMDASAYKAHTGK